MSSEVSKPQHPGIPFFMNGRKYIVPSLSLGQFEDSYELLTMPVTGNDDLRTNIARYVPIIGMAVRRNYPEVTDEQLHGWLGIGQFAKLLLVVQSATGMEEVEPGE